MINFKLNKKGSSISIFLYVLLVLFLCSVSIGLFLTSSNYIPRDFSDLNAPLSLNLDKEKIDLYIDIASKEAILETYLFLIESSTYNRTDVKFFEKEYSEGSLILVDSVQKNFEQNFSEIYLTKLIEKLNSLGDSEELISLINDSKKYDINFDGENLKLVVDFVLNYNSKNINSTFESKSKHNYQFSNEGLMNVSKIFLLSDACLELLDSPKNCIEENLNNFRVILIEKINVSSGEMNLVTIESKKEFLINNDFKKIKIKFVIPISKEQKQLSESVKFYIESEFFEKIEFPSYLGNVLN